MDSKLQDNTSAKKKSGLDTLGAGMEMPELQRSKEEKRVATRSHVRLVVKFVDQVVEWKERICI